MISISYCNYKNGRAKELEREAALFLRKFHKPWTKKQLLTLLLFFIYNFKWKQKTFLFFYFVIFFYCPQGEKCSRPHLAEIQTCTVYKNLSKHFLRKKKNADLFTMCTSWSVRQLCIIWFLTVGCDMWKSK